MDKTNGVIVMENSEEAQQVESILDNFVRKGRLKLEEVKVRAGSGYDLTYKFLAADAYSFVSSLYWTERSGVMTPNLLIEVALVKMPQKNRTEILEFAMSQNTLLPCPFRLAVNEGLLVLNLRAEIGGLSLEYLGELLDGLFRGCDYFYKEVQSRFGLPTALESLRADEHSSILH